MRTVVSVIAASLIATSAVALSSITEVGAVSPDVVISQVYGGGGNSGATYTNDFIELYNRGTDSGAARRLDGAVRQLGGDDLGRRPRSAAPCRRGRTTSSRRRRGRAGPRRFRPPTPRGRSR